jgi:hypothetical protein
MKYFIDSSYSTMNKHGEELCGDRVQIIRHKHSTTLVLADGLGSGVKANILSTLTSKILSTMMAQGAPIEECVATVLETLPVCRERGRNYCTFTMLHVKNDGSGVMYEYDNPQAVYIHGVQCGQLAREKAEICGKTVYKTSLSLDEGDAIAIMSDGVVFAGPGDTMNYDWQLPQVLDYMNSVIEPHMDAASIASLLAEACYALYDEKPGDDTTIAAIKLRKPKTVSIMIGPPVDKENDEKYITQFLNEGDTHIVCGGTTAQIVAGHLKKNVKLVEEIKGQEVPPISKIQGIDLVTEGAITIQKLKRLAHEYLDPYNRETKALKGEDGAVLMARLLFKEASRVVLFMGRTTNPAHTGTAADSGKKLEAVQDVCSSLRKMGKDVVELYD